MYREQFLVFAAAFVTLFAISAVSADKAPPEFKCLGEKIDLSDRETVIQQCREDLKEKLPAEGERPTEEMKGIWRCFETCTLRKLGVLNSDNKIDMSVLNDRVDKTIPQGAREGIKADVQKCADAMTEVLSDDDNCKNHASYQTCIMKAYMKNCSE